MNSRYRPKPRLNVQSNFLVYLWNVPQTIGGRELKRRLDSNYGPVRFIETFEAWTSRPQGRIIIEFASNAAVEFFVEAMAAERISYLKAPVGYVDMSAGRRQFFELVHRDTGVDLMQCDGHPPSEDWNRQREPRSYRSFTSTPYARSGGRGTGGNAVRAADNGRFAKRSPSPTTIGPFPQSANNNNSYGLRRFRWDAESGRTHILTFGEPAGCSQQQQRWPYSAAQLKEIEEGEIADEEEIGVHDRFDNATNSGYGGGGGGGGFYGNNMYSKVPSYGFTPNRQRSRSGNRSSAGWTPPPRYSSRPQTPVPSSPSHRFGNFTPNRRQRSRGGNGTSAGWTPPPLYSRPQTPVARPFQNSYQNRSRGGSTPAASPAVEPPRHHRARTPNYFARSSFHRQPPTPVLIYLSDDDNDDDSRVNRSSGFPAPRRRPQTPIISQQSACPPSRHFPPPQQQRNLRRSRSLCRLGSPPRRFPPRNNNFYGNNFFNNNGRDNQHSSSSYDGQRRRCRSQTPAPAGENPLVNLQVPTMADSDRSGLEAGYTPRFHQGHCSAADRSRSANRARSSDAGLRNFCAAPPFSSVPQQQQQQRSRSPNPNIDASLQFRLRELFGAPPPLPPAAAAASRRCSPTRSADDGSGNAAFAGVNNGGGPWGFNNNNNHRRRRHSFNVGVGGGGWQQFGKRPKWQQQQRGTSKSATASISCCEVITLNSDSEDEHPSSSRPPLKKDAAAPIDDEIIEVESSLKRDREAMDAYCESLELLEFGGAECPPAVTNNNNIPPSPRQEEQEGENDEESDEIDRLLDGGGTVVDTTLLDDEHILDESGDGEHHNEHDGDGEEGSKIVKSISQMSLTNSGQDDAIFRVLEISNLCRGFSLDRIREALQTVGDVPCMLEVSPTHARFHCDCGAERAARFLVEELEAEQREELLGAAPVFDIGAE